MSDAMKEAERLATEFGRACRLGPTGVVPAIEGDRLEQCAKDALLAFIRKLVEAQPAAEAGRALLMRLRQWDALDIPDTDGSFWKREIDAVLASPAAPLVGEPCHALIDAADLYADNWPDGDSIPANEVRAAITNAFYAGWRHASPAAPAGVPTDKALVWAVACLPTGAKNSVTLGTERKPVIGVEAAEAAIALIRANLAACDSSEASGSAIPARPTLPGEDAK